MGQTRKQNTVNKPILTHILIGAITALVIGIAGASLMAALIIGERIPIESIKLGIWTILFLSSLCGTLLGIKLANTQALVIGSAISLTYLLALSAINILFFDGTFQGVIVSALVVLAGSAVSIGLTLIGNGQPRRRRKTYSR